MCYRNVSLDEFRRAVHNAVSQEEPLATRFAGLSASGDRRGMVGILVEMPYVAGLKLGDSYEGKNDAQATRLYERSLGATTEPGDERAKEIKTCNILTQALFAAGANSRVFLDAICERARRFYNLRAYASCLRDCDCMLALPASFYDDSAENVKYFVQRRKECLQLERECSRKLEATSSRRHGTCRKTSTSFVASSPSSTRSSSSGALPTIDGKPHSCFTSCPDSVELRFDEARGRHLVATRDIRPGTVLIVDRPFSFSTDAPALGRNCLHCHATLKLEDSVRIPCRDCQTVSRSHDLHSRMPCAMYISARSNYFFYLRMLPPALIYLFFSFRERLQFAHRGSSDINFISRSPGGLLHGSVSQGSVGIVSPIRVLGIQLLLQKFVEQRMPANVLSLAGLSHNGHTSAIAAKQCGDRVRLKS